MRTGTSAPLTDAAPIVDLFGVDRTDDEGRGALERARAFAEPLLAGHPLETGEDAYEHAQGVARLLADIGAAPAVQAAAHLVYAGDFLARPDEVVGKAFGESYGSLVANTRKLVQAQRAVRAAPAAGAGTDAARTAEQLERVRRMLLAFSRDLRVVLLRLASRLQTLRFHAAHHSDCPPVLAQEALQVYAPLASRLGIWQIKWELEDLAFRFLHPESYRRIARLLDAKRVEREAGMEAVRAEVAALLEGEGMEADVQGRPKHIYSIWKKMQGKQLAFDQVFDLRALRVVVADVPACYAVLAAVQARYETLDAEFDDYIARPKPNGYQSLHAVIVAGDGRPAEVQIRTRAMHEHAELGVAAHWAYKEAGARGYGGVNAGDGLSAQMAEARKTVLRQLLAWERDVALPQGGPVEIDRVYVFTPQASIVELPAGGTPIDFAYHVHTDLGHRCRGARVDGVMVPLNTPLGNGQTVEIISAKDGGPSLDWINPELGFLASPRSRAKVRAWFNARAQGETIARGRELVEKLLQREGRTAVKLDHLAEGLGFRGADALFEVVGKDEYSLRNIEQWLRPIVPAQAGDEPVALQRSRAGGKGGGVLVVGVDSLMTSLARCCRPVPPDAIGGYVTRGKGVAVHRTDCGNFQHMAAASPGRVIEVEWGAPRAGQAAMYPLDLVVEAAERPGLLRDLTELLAKQRMNVTAVQTQAVRDAHGRSVRLALTVELSDGAALADALRQAQALAGVRSVRRR